MFVPEHYRTEDQRWPVRIVQDNPLALLMSNREGQPPYASHVPVIVLPRQREELERTGRWQGAVLHGHMNRANPHWKSLTDGQPAGLVFQGPAGYVSPSLYDTTPAAPTWNFTAVHVQGRLRLVEDEEATLGVVSATAGQLEERFGEQWSMDSSVGYFRQLLPGVGAFELHVEECDAMFKLSQEKEHDVRHAVMDWCARSPRGRSNDLATVMCDYYRAAVSRPS
ncbi:FMN-binding negative transcriptional regulator [Streptomyces sp. OE57]|uniref:FMN-binding negative transcriptional regulator n=1 Tax=Streptomyces lacaronensis TaxID=3379885 RepID=UPI0039B769F5